MNQIGSPQLRQGCCQVWRQVKYSKPKTSDSDFEDDNEPKDSNHDETKDQPGNCCTNVCLKSNGKSEGSKSIIFEECLAYSAHEHYMADYLGHMVMNEWSSASYTHFNELREVFKQGRYRIRKLKDIDDLNEKFSLLTGDGNKNIFTDDSKAEDISKCQKESKYFKTNSTRSEIKILDEYASKKNGLYFPIFLIHCDSKNQYYTAEEDKNVSIEIFVLPNPIQMKTTFGISTPVRYLSLVFTDCSTEEEILPQLKSVNLSKKYNSLDLTLDDVHHFKTQKYLARSLALISRQKLFMRALLFENLKPDFQQTKIDKCFEDYLNKRHILVMGVAQNESTHTLRALTSTDVCRMSLSFDDSKFRFSSNLFTDCFDRVLQFKNCEVCPNIRYFLSPVKVFVHLLATNIAFMYIYNSKWLEKDTDVVIAMIFNMLCGIALGIFSSRPLMVVGLSGPVSIYEKLVYEGFKLIFKEREDYIEILFAFRFIISVITFLLLTIVSMFDLPRFASYFTNFTEEIFELEIAITFLIIAIKAIFFHHDSETHEQQVHSSAVLSLLALLFAILMDKVYRNEIISRKISGFLKNFGLVIVIFSLFIADKTIFSDIEGPFLMSESIAIENISLYRGNDFSDSFLGSLKNFKNSEKFAHLLALAFAYSIGLTCLLVLETVLVEKEIDHLTQKLKNYSFKGSKYSLNMFLVGLMQLFSGIFRYPIMVPSGFHSRMFVSSITTKEREIDSDFAHLSKPTKFNFSRLFVFMIYVQLLIPALFNTFFTLISVGIMLGILIFFALNLLQALELFSRLQFFLVPRKRRLLVKKTGYPHKVPVFFINLYTVVQLSLFALILVIEYSPLCGPLFGVGIALSAIVQNHILHRTCFSKDHLIELQTPPSHKIVAMNVVT